MLQEINNSINQSSGYLGAISDRSKKLYLNQQTVGENLYAQLVKNRHTSLKNKVFYRQDYLDEFETIWGPDPVQVRHAGERLEILGLGGGEHVDVRRRRRRSRSASRRRGPSRAGPATVPRLTSSVSLAASSTSPCAELIRTVSPSPIPRAAASSGWIRARWTRSPLISFSELCIQELCERSSRSPISSSGNSLADAGCRRDRGAARPRAGDLRRIEVDELVVVAQLAPAGCRPPSSAPARCRAGWPASLPALRPPRRSPKRSPSGPIRSRSSTRRRGEILIPTLPSSRRAEHRGGHDADPLGDLLDDLPLLARLAARLDDRPRSSG